MNGANEKAYDPYGNLDVELGTPPPCYLHMKAELIEYDPEGGLTVAFPVVQSYLNPAGTMQGGFITAAFDNVFGPLCYLATGTRASAMLDINNSYHRPAFAGDLLTISARVKTKGRTVVHMQGEAYNQENKLVASAHCNYMITKPAK